MSINNRIEFKAGQLWKYKGREGVENSKLLILHVEIFNDQNVVHIAVVGGGADGPMHMPFSEVAVRESVIDLCEEGCSITGYEEGYLYWRHQYEKGEAGIYKIPIAEALDL